jgi:hypothetical protein
MKAPATTRLGKVAEWGEQTAWNVVAKSSLMGKTPAEIAEDMLPFGPKLRSIQGILKRFNDGMARLTGRDRKKRSDSKLYGAQRDRLGFTRSSSSCSCSSCSCSCSSSSSSSSSPASVCPRLRLYTVHARACVSEL